MPIPEHLARQVRDRILGDGAMQAELLQPRLPSDQPLPPRLPHGNDCTAKACHQRRELLAGQGCATETAAQLASAMPPADLSANIENFVGYVGMPLGVAGPLRINGTALRDDVYLPLATHEGALVASYHRGAYLASQAGGVTAVCLSEVVSRAPCFVFDSVVAAGQFLAGVLERVESLQALVDTTSSHCQLLDLRPCLTGQELTIIFDFSTGDAAGQNMVTLATQAIGEYLVEQLEPRPRDWYVEGNMSGDKKATMLAHTSTRGKKVVAEVRIPGALLQKVTRATPAQMVRYWEISLMGGIQSGSIGVQGHFANALAALFIACGQDAACVAEAAIGLTRLAVTDSDDLYLSVSLPNLIVGTVGGGTHLPSARECLAMLGCQGTGSARRFAEICAAAVLAGEVSIIASLAAGDFAQAHGRYGRPGARP